MRTYFSDELIHAVRGLLFYILEGMQVLSMKYLDGFLPIPCKSRLHEIYEDKQQTFSSLCSLDSCLIPAARRSGNEFRFVFWNNDASLRLGRGITQSESGAVDGHCTANSYFVTAKMMWGGNTYLASRSESGWICKLQGEDC